jgi:DNA-binding MarR family transcriptional regulator
MNNPNLAPCLNESVGPTAWPGLWASHVPTALPPKAQICEIAKRLLFLAWHPDETIDHIHFGDLSWITLLTLFLAKNQGKPLSVTELRSLMAMPTKSAQRLIHHLTSSGHIKREQDIADGRRFNLTLGEIAEVAIERQLYILVESHSVQR